MNLRLAVILILTSLVLPCAAFAECSDKLLNPKITSYTKDVRVRAYIAAMLTEEQFNKSDTSLGGSYKMFGFSYADAKEAQRRYESYTQSSLSYDEAVTFFQMVGDPAGYDAYLQCKKLERGNTYFAAGVEGAPDGKEFIVTIEWFPAVGDKGGLNNVTASVVNATISKTDPLKKTLGMGSDSFTISRANVGDRIDLAVKGVDAKNVSRRTDAIVIGGYKPYVDMFPKYVDSSMIKECATRSATPKPVCAAPYVSLLGTYHDQGVIYTQPSGGSLPEAYAVIDVPEGARQILFTVGDYYTGSDCYGKPNMIVRVEVDGAMLWGEYTLPDGQPLSARVLFPEKHAKIVKLLARTDGPADCDDAVWASVRFDE